MRFMTLIALIGLGCSDGNDDWTAHAGSDSAVIVGQVQSALHENPRVRINGEARNIELDEDRGFAVRGVPVGDVVVEFEQGDVRGSVTVTDVAAGEVLDIDVVVDEDGQIHIRVARHLGEPAPPVARRGALIYDAKNTTHQLRPGVYEGDLIIDAKNVTVLGARDRNCDGEGATILDGNLYIGAKDARVVDVIVLGEIIVEHGAKNARILDTCARRGFWDDDSSDDDSSS